MPLQSLFARNNNYQWLAAIASGGMLVLAFPKFNWYWLAWVALIPLLLALTQEAHNWRRAGGLGWLTGWMFFFFGGNWITHSMISYGGINVVLAYGIAALFAAILAIFPALFAVLTNRLTQRFGRKALALTPFIWAATEWLRALVTGVTWNELGLSQADWFAVAQLARIGGAPLISALLVATSAFVVSFWRGRKVPIELLLVITIFLALILVSIRTRIQQSVTEVAVAGVQPNLPVDILTHQSAMTERNESGIETNLRLTREAIARVIDKKADLVVWAESPLVLDYEQDEAAKAKINALAKETNAFVIFSAVGREGQQVYNSAQTITPTGQALKRYDKIRLVPFGEYVPYRSVLGHLVPAMIGDFTPGSNAVINSLKLSPRLAIVQNEEETQGELALERTTSFVKSGTFICYEAAYPNIVRQFVNNGASLLINVSDDAWFGNSAGAQQHLQHVRLRAIETNRDIVRVTNSGISALIMANGNVVDPLPMFSAASRVWTAREYRGLTVYARYGDWFAMASAALAAIAILLSFVYHSQTKRPQA